MKILIFLLLLSNKAYSQVRVAFIEQIDSKGRTHNPLEPGGTFFHLAIQIETGEWLQSHPKHGTILTRGLDTELGYVTQILENYELPLISYNEIKDLVGQPFDKTFGFKDTKSSYCSKVVALILNVPPKKRMGFQSHVWTNSDHVNKGQKGWSPDYVFNYLLQETSFTPALPFAMRMKIDVQRLPFPTSPKITASSCVRLLK